MSLEILINSFMTISEVRMQRQFLDPLTGDPLMSSDIDQYLEYGERKVKFTADEIRSMKKAMLDHSNGLKLLAFKPVNQLDWSYFVRSSNFLYPEESMVKGSRQLFAALWTKCMEKQVAPICAYKQSATSLPNFVALLAQNESLHDDGLQKNPPVRLHTTSIYVNPC